MPRYRSKPTEIEAYQLTRELLHAHVLDRGAVPLPGVEVTAATYHQGRKEVTSTRQRVTTIQGQHVFVEPGEWIVQESDGVHYYPIADDVFRRKYALAETPAPLEEGPRKA